VAGKLLSAYGIKGWVKVHSYTDPVENIFNFNPWYLISTEGSQKATAVVIDDYRTHGKGLVAHIKNVDDRDAAALLCQRLVTVDMGDFPQLPDGEYYWRQLIGLNVFSRFEESAPVLLGKITSMMETGANDVMVVSPCDGSIDKRERLLPYVDMYIVKIEIPEGCMWVDWDPEF
jgi:16S rRNA processing protein RimM